uniref:Coagulation factor VIII, procoagulant component n=1 Tax=Lates calcarifer TaxID=8187 RepID=A0A4W6C3F6_LATCA
MRPTLLLLLLPLLHSSAGEAQRSDNVREYYIAAVEIGWDYVYLDDVDPPSDQRRRFGDIPQKFIKAVYREYTDSTYTLPKPRPAWTGIQGPVIVAQAGDRVVVHFKNLASQPYSISPVGITYWKQSEGAGYDDSTAGQEKEDDAVSPGGYYEYVWDISPKDGPTTSDPDCLTYSYSSQVDTVRDINSGLIGALLICKSSLRRDQAFVLLFAVFDETKSWYGEVGERMSRERFKRSQGRKEYHTINGYVNSTLPGNEPGRNHVFWHMIGVGTAPEIHSIKKLWTKFKFCFSQVLTHRKVTLEVTPMTFITAEMKPTTTGRFLISCQIHAHRHDGMNALFTVEKCETQPGPDLRNVKHKDYGGDVDDYSYEDGDMLFNTISFEPKRPQVQARASRGQQFATWQHYIAAEEVTWNYAPHLKPTDRKLQSRYLPTSPHHLGYKYKKVVYVEYTDASFTQRKNPDNTLLGPLLKGKVNDHFHITFKNLASRPFNIYPNGLTKIFPLQKTTNGKPKHDLRSMGVPPNGTFHYIWMLTTDDGPLEGDPQCLTQLYQSTISPERDLASGLVGTLLICKYEAIDLRGRLVGPDKDWRLIFAVFDENRSWYFNENLQKSSMSSPNTTDPEFYNSNVIYSVNGIMFSGRQFVMCQTDVTFWHVASVGTQSDFLSIYFTGNLFQHQGLYQSVLTLFPMTGMIVPMETELTGKISAFDGSLKSRGMSILYTVIPCDNGDLPLVDRDEENEDISDFIDKINLQPRGIRPQNDTILVKVCKKPLANNNTQSGNSSGQNVTAEGQSICQLKRVKVTSPRGEEPNEVSDEGVPQDILEEIAREGDGIDLTRPFREMRRGMRKFLPEYKKVVFRGYSDETFLNPTGRGELQEHLGIMGPFIRAEINDFVTVVFKNKASRPYSFHLQGVYDGSQGAGIAQTHAYSAPPGTPGEPVAPGEARTYNWRITAKQGPTETEFDCKTGAYYSTVDKEKDLHSGLIGPLVICKSGILRNHQPEVQEFSLLFHTFDETKSWYMEENLSQHCAPPCQANTEDPWYHISNKFAAINGYVAETLPGLLVAQHQQVRWHLMNVGSDGEYHAVHFHGLPFTIHTEQEHRMGVYNLFPGVFGTVEMRPPTVGTWLVECTIGDYQLAGMRAKLLVYNPRCVLPLGMKSGRIEDSQITASDHIDNWEPRLARLEQSGYINAWMGRGKNSWIQVDLQRPTLLHGVKTQGVRSKLKDHYITIFTVSYSLDQDTWTTYRGNSTRQNNIFRGNFDSSKVRDNSFYPPFVARYVRIQPLNFMHKPALRLELLGCDLNSCSLPLGLQKGQRQIPDSSFDASSFQSSLFRTWRPSLARLHQEGGTNAWRPMNNNPHEWLQVDLGNIKRITGVITQGARLLLTQMMVTEFSVTISHDGHSWSSVLEKNSQREQIFTGNNDSDEEAVTVFDPPLFGRYLRIHPRGWINDIALRLEVLGCETQQVL